MQTSALMSLRFHGEGVESVVIGNDAEVSDFNHFTTFRAVLHDYAPQRVILIKLVQNVFILTGYSGMDPETTAENGIDNIIWPRPRTYSLRLNVNF